MGIAVPLQSLGRQQTKPKKKMFKFVTLFALVAAALAEPEADAQYLVNRYNNWWGNQVGQMVYAAPKMAYTHQYVKPAVTYANMPYAWNNAYQHSAYAPYSVRLFKREAEAESEANHHYTNAYGFNYNTYAYMPQMQYAARQVVDYDAPTMQYAILKAMPYAWNNAYQHSAYAPYSVRLFKREAEAESEANHHFTYLPQMQYKAPWAATYPNVYANNWAATYPNVYANNWATTYPNVYANNWYNNWMATY